MEKYEQVIIKCPACGKRMKIIKLKAISTEGLLCQKCGQGGEKTEND
jgi:ssDNA-binding Zn-finger/Zn-ribbon topoisomerase 1